MSMLNPRRDSLTTGELASRQPTPRLNLKPHQTVGHCPPIGGDGAIMSEIQAGFTFGSKAMTLANKTFGPWFTRRRADADAYAAITTALADGMAELIEANPSDPVLLEALISCGGKSNLDNLVRILLKASPQLIEGARPDLISDDWAANFKDKARTCSDPDMAELWAQLLAGEANKPGSYTRKAVNTLGDMGKVDAELFCSLCQFQLMFGTDGQRTPVIIQGKIDIYGRWGITNDSLGVLRELGLVSHVGDPLGGISLGCVTECNVLGHSEGILYFTRRDGTNDPVEVRTGSVQLTRTGAEISNLCLPLCNPPGFVDALVGEWENRDRDFDIRKYPQTMKFAEGTFRVRSDLGRITGPHPP